MSDLPTCKDFIIPALRELRTKSNKLKEGTAGPTSLEKLCYVADGLLPPTDYQGNSLGLEGREISYRRLLFGSSTR